MGSPTARVAAIVSSMVAGTVAVSPAGDFMLGDVQNSLVRQTGLVKLVRFGCP